MEQDALGCMNCAYCEVQNGRVLCGYFDGEGYSMCVEDDPAGRAYALEPEVKFYRSLANLMAAKLPRGAVLAAYQKAENDAEEACHALFA